MSDAPNRPLRVLVVDDDRNAAAALAALLSAAGCAVEAAWDGPAALAAAARFGADVCLLDIDLPGMNGYDLARQLRADGGPSPVLATVTGFGDDLHLERAAEAGFDLHFTKPVDPADVLDQVRGCLRAGC